MAYLQEREKKILFIALPSSPGQHRRAPVVVAALSWSYFLLTLGLWGLLRAGDVWWPATLLMFSPRGLLALPLVPLFLAAVLWRRRSLALLLFTLALIAGPIMGFSIPWQRLWSETPHRPVLRVLTCNMHYQQARPAVLLNLLAETRPDIVAIQEWGEADPSAYFPPNEWHTRKELRLFLASRGSIRHAERIGLHSTYDRGSVMRYDLETFTGTVHFFSLHLASPREGLYEILHQPRKGITELQAGSALRGEQFENLSLEIANVSGPLLLAGDFNTPTESVLFRDVWGRYSDAFTSAGWGWGYTFVGDRTRVRIDHILAGPGWHCSRCWVGPNIGSPHRPILADLVWTGDRAER